MSPVVHLSRPSKWRYHITDFIITLNRNWRRIAARAWARVNFYWKLSENQSNESCFNLNRPLEWPTTHLFHYLVPRNSTQIGIRIRDTVAWHYPGKKYPRSRFIWMLIWFIVYSKSSTYDPRSRSYVESGSKAEPNKGCWKIMLRLWFERVSYVVYFTLQIHK